MSYGPYACPVCRGYGEVVCTCCGSEVDCEHCDGRCYDPDKIDLDAYDAACKKLDAASAAAGRTALSWAAQDENDPLTITGRTNGVDTVLVKDFTLASMGSDLQIQWEAGE
jgi:hypothetical protein